MVETNDDVLDELSSELETLTLDELVRIVETNHPTDGPGVERDVVEAYVTAVPHGEEAFSAELDGLLTDADSWQGEEYVHDLGDGRVSAYPARWHEELRGSADVREYLRVVSAERRRPGTTVRP